MLPGVETIPESLLFLSEFHAVLFQNGIADERALSRMEWGITGQKPKPPTSPSSLENITANYSTNYIYAGRATQDPPNLTGFADIFESFFSGFALKNGSPEIKINEWAREWFINVGEKQGHLLWEDCVRYGCISAGGGRKYRKAIQKLEPGDIVYAYITGSGYVGYGRVVENAVSAKDFLVESLPLLEQRLVTIGFEENKDEDNLDITDWIVRVEWLKAYKREQARFFSGAFVHRGTLCKFNQEETLDFLHREFGM